MGELSVRVRVPVRGPAAVGVKASCRVQAAATARVAAAGVGSGDDSEVAGDGCVADSEGKAAVVGEGDDGRERVRPTPVAGKLMADGRARGRRRAGATPVPVSETVWVRYWSVTVRVPVAGPTQWAGR